MTRSLIIIDVQNDFCEGGTLPVQGGARVAKSVTALVNDPANASRWSSVLLTRDWHIDPGDHWVGAGEEPNFVDTWPVHCQAETTGAAFHAALQVRADEIFSKGRTSACYSGFEGTADTDGSPLQQWLTQRGTTEVELAGLATDHCVRATALDAAAGGFAVSVLLDHCAGITPETTEAALAAMTAAGVTLVGGGY